MNPWSETLVAVFVAALGIGVGYFSSRLRRPYWLLGYILPLVVVLLVGLGRIVAPLAFIPPFSWLLTGRARFAVLGAVCATLLTTPLSRLRHKRQKVVLGCFILFFIGYYTVLPFLLPAFIRGSLSDIETHIDIDGVCLQSTPYTCAPAAAVTALRLVGLPAEEGEIAILAHTTPITGTLPDLLSQALADRYHKQGLACKYRRFEGVDEIPCDGRITIVVTKLSFLVDHYMAVLEVLQDEVRVGDPRTGERTLSHEDFEEIWRHSGIVLQRE